MRIGGKASEGGKREQGIVENDGTNSVSQKANFSFMWLTKENH